MAAQAYIKISSCFNMQIVNVCRSKTRNLESRNQKILVISFLYQFLLLFVLLLRYRRVFLTDVFCN